MSDTPIITDEVLAEQSRRLDSAMGGLKRSIAIVMAERDALAKATRRLLTAIDDEGDGWSPEPSCQECTQGCTPYRLEKGPCAYHEAKAAVDRVSA